MKIEQADRTLYITPLPMPTEEQLFLKPSFRNSVSAFVLDTNL